MDKYISLNSYKAGRSCLLAVTVLTLLNILMLLMGSDVSFLYSAILPQIAVVIASELNSGMQSYLIVFVFAIIPVVLFAICYVLSKKEWKWLLIGTILMAVDFVCLILFSFLAGFVGLLLNYVFTIIILVTMFKGVQAGKQLGNDFEKPNMEETVKEDFEKDTKIYYYDAQLAKQNKVNKMWLFLLSTFGFLIVEIVIAFFAAVMSDSSNEPIISICAIIFAIAIIALYFFIAIKISPFVSTASYSYYKKDDVVYRISNSSMVTVQMFANLLVEKEDEKAYYCSYISQNGKSRKVIIPKCYPEIDEILY